MKTQNIETGNYRLKITSPELYFYTRSPFAYVRVVETGGVASGDISIEVYNEDKAISATRAFHLNGTSNEAVFPISEFVEALPRSSSTLDVSIRLIADGETVEIGVFHAICGVCNSEVLDFATLSEEGEFYAPPYYKKVALYTNAPTRLTTDFVTPENGPTSKDVEVFGSSVPLAISKTGITPLSHAFVGISETDPKDREGQVVFRYTFPTGEITYSVNAVMDTCGEGLFVKWEDRHGLNMCYRFDVEKTVEKSSIGETYREVYEWSGARSTRSQNITSAEKTYVLHSRMIDKDLAEMVISIFTGHNIMYWDTENYRWVPVIVGECEVEDDLSPMLNIVVEMFQEIETMQW